MLDLILAEGLRPRGDAIGNFAHSVPSHPGAVYLTDTYPAYFAAGGDGQRVGLVVEVDVTALDPKALRADEDYLASIEPGGHTEAWVRHHRDRLVDVASSWVDSLAGLGTCAHLGVVPPTAITRIARIDFTRAPVLACAALDMSISMMNFRLCAFDHRALLAWIFGDPEPDASGDDAAFSFRRFGIRPGCREEEREAITILHMKKGP